MNMEDMVIVVVVVFEMDFCIGSIDFGFVFYFGEVGDYFFFFDFVFGFLIFFDIFYMVFDW